MTIEETIRQAVREELRAVLEELRGLAQGGAPEPASPGLLTVAEAAAAARCAPATIREWINRGELRAVKRGRWLIARAELERALARRLSTVPAEDVDLEAEAARIVALDRRDG